jgi:hypothetical protein|nr:MAG TPA: Protein of unknown function (DUF2800) [Caudoviricetes sp.]
MMAEDKKILEAPKKVVDGLVEVFEGLAQMFSGVSDQLEKNPLLAADPEDEIPRPLAEVPALSEKKGAAAPHPRKKPVKKIRKADVPVEEPAEVPVADEPAVEDDVNSGSSLEQPATESDSAENDSADGETADSDFPVDDADALPWNEDTGQKDTAPAEAEPKAGYTDIYKTELISLTEFEKLMGKKKFQEILGEYVAKPPGKLTLVPDSDPRQAVDLQTAEDEFTPLD